MPIITLRDVTVRFSQHPLFQHIDLQIDAGEKVCLIGRNGEGKTTLLNTIAREIQPDQGEIITQQSIRIEQLSQEIPVSIQGSVYDVVASVFRPNELHEPHEIDTVLSKLSLDPTVEFSSLSGGLKRRVLFARALVRKPDLLLLDEPTNHLDIEAIQWLEKLCLSYSGALLFVTHDRTFLQKIATRILELDRSNLTSWECDYATYLRRKEAALIAEEQANKNFDKKLAQEEYWVRHGISARRTRNQGRVRNLEALRRIRAERRTTIGKVNLQLQPSEHSGKIVIQAKNADFGYADHTIIQNFSTTIMRGEKIGIIGANGTGKTTLLRLLLGDLLPQSGSIRHGTKLQVAYFDQLRSQLNEEKTLRDNVSGGSDSVTINGKQKHIVGYLQDFLFEPRKVLTPVKNLSGGEKNRLLLAKLLIQPANVLVLDEPTNDLDIETLELLEEMLVAYQGTLLLVSHDRTFLNNVVTSTIVFEGAGALNEYVGGYDDYLRQSQQTKTVETKSKKVAKPKEKKTKATLTYNEKRELASLPKLIEQLEQEQQKLTQALSDPTFYQDKEKAIQTTKDLKAIEKKLTHAFTQWESLENKNR